MLVVSHVKMNMRLRDGNIVDAFQRVRISGSDKDNVAFIASVVFFINGKYKSSRGDINDFVVKNGAWPDLERGAHVRADGTAHVWRNCI